MNIKLLKRVAAEILKTPKRLYMGNWVVQAPDLPAPCKTAACIAGHAVIMEQMDKTKKSFATVAGMLLIKWHYDSREAKDKALKLLRLTPAQGERLFYTNYWPAEFHLTHRDARTAKAKAKATVARINHFIKTKGAE